MAEELDPYDYANIFTQYEDENGKTFFNLTNSLNIEGEIDPNVNPRYGMDFFLGDIVQLSNEIGLSATARISEFTYSQSPTGINAYPTFVIIKE